MASTIQGGRLLRGCSPLLAYWGPRHREPSRRSTPLPWQGPSVLENSGSAPRGRECSCTPVSIVGLERIVRRAPRAARPLRRRQVKAILIPQIPVGVSQDGTAGNAKLFMAVWDKAPRAPALPGCCSRKSGAGKHYGHAHTGLPSQASHFRFLLGRRGAGCRLRQHGPTAHPRSKSRR